MQLRYIFGSIKTIALINIFCIKMDEKNRPTYSNSANNLDEKLKIN